MRRLQMGMWHQFDENRWNDYSLDGLNGMEICSFPDTDHLERLHAFCEERGYGFGVHGPLLNARGYRLPRLNDPDRAIRQEALAQVEEEAGLAARFGADYILYHYPFHPVFQPPIRKLYPKLPDAGARIPYSRMSRDAFRDISRQLFEALADIQHRSGQRILLEHDFFGDYADVFVDMFDEYPEIGLVIDTARLDLTKRAFYGFDPYPFLDAVAPHVYVVHYSNVQYEADTFTHHLPVRDTDEADPQFGDAAAYLRHLAARNDAFHVTFEFNPERASTDELRSIYRTAASLSGIAKPK